MMLPSPPNTRSGRPWRCCLVVPRCRGAGCPSGELGDRERQLGALYKGRILWTLDRADRRGVCMPHYGC